MAQPDRQPKAGDVWRKVYHLERGNQYGAEERIDKVTALCVFTRMANNPVQWRFRYPTVDFLRHFEFVREGK